MTEATLYENYPTEPEEIVLGSMFGPFTSKDHVAACIEYLEEEDFTDRGNRDVFCTIKQLFLDGRDLSAPLTLLQALRENGKLTVAGGPGYLLDLLHYAPSLRNAREHISQVKFNRRLRELRAIQAQEVVTPGDVDHISSALVAVADDLQATRRRELAGLGGELGYLLEDLEEQKTPLAFATGIKALDNIVSGFKKGQFVVVGARTSTGKSALLLQIAVNAALQGWSVLHISVEMTRREVANRVMAQQSGVLLHNLAAPAFLSERDWKSLVDTHGRLKNLHFEVGDYGYAIEDVIAAFRRTKARRGVDLLVVDYLQQIGTSVTGTRAEQIADVSRKLKALALSDEICVLSASQFSRLHEKEDRAPRLSDLRESGSLEHDADVVLLMNAKPSDLASQIPTDINVAKNRQGPRGNVAALFNATIGKFEER